MKYIPKSTGAPVSDLEYRNDMDETFSRVETLIGPDSRIADISSPLYKEILHYSEPHKNQSVGVDYLIQDNQPSDARLEYMSGICYHSSKYIGLSEFPYSDTNYRIPWGVLCISNDGVNWINTGKKYYQNSYLLTKVVSGKSIAILVELYITYHTSELIPLHYGNVDDYGNFSHHTTIKTYASESTYSVHSVFDINESEIGLVFHDWHDKYRRFLILTTLQIDFVGTEPRIGSQKDFNLKSLGIYPPDDKVVGGNSLTSAHILPANQKCNSGWGDPPSPSKIFFVESCQSEAKFLWILDYIDRKIVSISDLTPLLDKNAHTNFGFVCEKLIGNRLILNYFDSKDRVSISMDGVLVKKPFGDFENIIRSKILSILPDVIRVTFPIINGRSRTRNTCYDFGDGIQIEEFEISASKFYSYRQPTIQFFVDYRQKRVWWCSDYVVSMNEDSWHFPSTGWQCVFRDGYMVFAGGKVIVGADDNHYIEDPERGIKPTVHKIPLSSFNQIV